MLLASIFFKYLQVRARIKDIKTINWEGGGEIYLSSYIYIPWYKEKRSIYLKFLQLDLNTLNWSKPTQHKGSDQIN